MSARIWKYRRENKGLKANIARMLPARRNRRKSFRASSSDDANEALQKRLAFWRTQIAQWPGAYHYAHPPRPWRRW